MNVYVCDHMCVNLCMCAYVYVYVCVKACVHRYVCIVYMYICMCVVYTMSMCVCMHICACVEIRGQKGQVSPQLLPISFFMSLHWTWRLLTRQDWLTSGFQEPSLPPLPVGMITEACHCAQFSLDSGGSNSGLPAYTVSTVPTEPSLLFHNFLLDRNHLTGQPHRQCEWTQKFSGTPRLQSAIKSLIRSQHSQSSLPPRHGVEAS